MSASSWRRRAAARLTRAGSSPSASPTSRSAFAVVRCEPTIALGTAALYVALFVVSLLGAAALIYPAALKESVGHGVGVGDYLRLAWLVATIATVGGVLGSLIDSDTAIRNAVYHPRAGRGEVRDSPAWFELTIVSRTRLNSEMHMSGRRR
jgi:hypothetical protein